VSLPNIFGDAENGAKTWLHATEVAPLVTHAGRVHIYLAMPTAAPVPSLICSRVGGAVSAAKHLPTDRARLSFDCWGTSRAQAQQISARLVSELDMLGPRGGYTIPGEITLATADIISWLWLPDPRADTPRYVVDALITALPA